MRGHAVSCARRGIGYLGSVADIKRILKNAGLLAVVLLAGCVKSSVAGPGDADAAAKKIPNTHSISTNSTMDNKVIKTDAEWRKELAPEQYEVLRQKGTERAFSGKYWNHKGDGVYRCAGCGQELFTSGTKFDSGCGWPSFFAAAGTNVIVQQDDKSHFMTRTEVLCARCGGHLGHVFDDGPQPTGLRYCINSASIDFKKKDDAPTGSAPGGNATNAPAKK